MFATTFWTPYTDYKEKIGQTFEVVGQKPKDSYDHAEVGDMWMIKLEDGVQIDAFPEEIILEHQLNNGRPKDSLTLTEKKEFVSGFISKELDNYNQNEMLDKRDMEAMERLQQDYDNINNYGDTLEKDNPTLIEELYKKYVG
jgi:hypothetical protein